MHYLLSVPILKFVVSRFWWMTLVYLHPLILSSKKQIPFYAQTLLIICRCKQIPCNLIPSNDGSKDYNYNPLKIVDNSMGMQSMYTIMISPRCICFWNREIALGFLTIHSMLYVTIWIKKQNGGFKITTHTQKDTHGNW